MKSLRALPIILALASSAMAVKTQFWTHATREQLAEGETENVLLTNHGQLRLSRQLTPLLTDAAPAAAVQAIALAPDGSVVFATFPDGTVMRLKDGKADTLADLKKQTVTALRVAPDGSVYAATAGEQAQVQRVEAGKPPQTVFSQAGVQYVWSIVPRGDKLVLATGPEARIIEIDAAGKGEAQEIAQLGGHNVLSMVAAPDGTLYAGTDVDGLVYRIDAEKNKPFLLFDAAETEISSLALDGKGRLLVGTGEAKEQQQNAAAAGGAGKPEADEPGDAIPGESPDAPQAPDNDDAGTIPGARPDSPEAADPAQDGDEAETKKPAKAKPTAGPVPPASTEGEEPTLGNAVYRVDGRSGFVTEIFRENVVVYDLAVQGDSVLIGTGNDGQVFEVRPQEEEASVVVETDSAQVNAVRVAGDGIYLALSNPGGVARLSSGHAAQGVYTSPVLDAGVASSFGMLQLRGQLPDKTSITVATRSGNAGDPATGTWSDWSDEQPAREFLPVASPAARYLQYRLSLKTEDPSVSPAIDEVIVAYQTPNVAPRIASISVKSAEDENKPGLHTIEWSAEDANEDKITYSLHARALGRGGWVKVADDLTEASAAWNARDYPDGRYQIRVTASDASDNQPGEGKSASRVSDVVVIDNSAPVIGDVKTEDTADGVKVTLRVVDRGGALARLDYAIDSADDWQRRLPDDTMADSPEERYTLLIKGLDKGPHTLTVRATDQAGNASFETIGLQVK